MSHTAQTPSLANAEELVVRYVEIPPCPKILIEVIGEMRLDDPDYRRIAHLIHQDTALAAAVVATANSAYYGFTSKASTIREACMMLGLRATAYLVTGLLLRRVFRTDSSEHMEQFWSLSGATATLAARLAKRLRVTDRETGHTYGLFKNCGVAAMLMRFPDYGEMLSEVAGQEIVQPVVEIEKTRFGINHAQVGALLARSWLLPETICAAIEHHHDYERLTDDRAGLSTESRRLIALGCLAEDLHWIEERGAHAPEWALCSGAVLATLGLEQEAVESLGALA